MADGMDSLTIEPISPNIGAYVTIAWQNVVDKGVPEQIMQALNTYNVLVFPEIHMPDDMFLALTEALGEMQQTPVTHDGSAVSRSGIYRIALDKDSQTQRDFVKGNDFWHMDGTSYDVPGKGTLLKCETPPSAGGDTGFANLFAAYDALPDGRKRQIENLRVEHCLAAVGVKMYDHPTPGDFARWDAVFPPREHPLVWHQNDGRTSIVIGSTARAVVGMDREASATLLDDLLDWCTGARFTYRHHWRKGDLVIFNNPGLLHRSYPYDEGAGRVLHRTTLKGIEAFG